MKQIISTALYRVLLSSILVAVSGCYSIQRHHFWGFSTQYKTTFFEEVYSERSEDPRIVDHPWLSKEEREDRLFFIGRLEVIIEEGDVPSEGSIADFAKEKGCDVVAMRGRPFDSYLYVEGNINVPHPNPNWKFGKVIPVDWSVDEYYINCYRYLSDDEMERLEQRDQVYLREKAEREKAEREKAEREKAEREKAEREKAEREKAEREKAEREKAEREKQ